MRTALAARDIAGVFRQLQRVGVSQRRIAALTGQSQSEISEILGGRQVVSYEVLTRIADGLDVPRGQLGLAYDEVTAQLVGAGGPEGTDDGEEDSRNLMARLTELTVGPGPVDQQSWPQPFALAWAPAPDQVGVSDVARLAGITAQLRGMDREHGGGACRDAAVAQVAWAQQLLRARVGDESLRGLHIAVSDVHLLAGWTSFDVGMVGPARRHFARALEHARFIEEPTLVAKALYCLGRLHLHHGWSAQALRLFQLGQFSAQQSGNGRTAAMLHANEGWAHAVLGETRQALASVSRARDEYTRSEQEPAPDWVMFFNSAELQALRATTLAALPDPTPQQRAEAIERFSLSTALRELTMARSRAFELTALAYLLLLDGDIDQGIHIGQQMIDIAAQLRSLRVIDRTAPLRLVAQPHLSHPGVRDLMARLDGLRMR